MAAGDRPATERTSLLHIEPDPVDGPSLAPNTPEDVAIERDGAQAEGFSRLRGSSIFLCLGILVFLQGSNISLLTTTQGFIAEELDAFSQVSWFTSTYLIAMSSLAPLGGRICKITSPRAYITFSTFILSIGVVVTSLASSLAVFLLGRAITGVGSAGIYSVSTIVVLQLSGAKRRGLFVGLLNTGLTIGVSLGAVIAGAMVEPLGWRPIFWLQAPLASAAGTGIFFSSPTSISVAEGGHKESIRSQITKIDYFGALAWVSTIVLFLYGLSAQKILLLPILLSFFTLALFLLIESRLAVEPVIPVAVLRSQGVLCSCLATLGLMMARWTVLFYTPVYTIAVRGWSQAEAGLILFPTNFGFGVGGLLAGWIHIRRSGSFYLSCVTTFLLFAASLFLLAYLSTASSSAIVYMLAAFMNGAITGAILNYTLAHLLHLSPLQTHTIATPLLATFRGFAGSFGSAIGGGIFVRTLQHALETGFVKAGLEGREKLVTRLLGSPALAASLEGTERQVAVQGFQTALQTLFAAGSGLALAVTAVQAGTGWRGSDEKKDVVDLERRLDGRDDEHQRVS